MKKTFCIFLLAPFFSFSQESLDSVFKNANLTGVQLVFTDNNKTQTHYYGKPNADEPGSVNGSTVFQAASLSKCVFAYIVLRLADRKIISLDTPLSHYYTYDRIKADTAAQQITARMVLQHRTGFPNWAYNPTSKEWAKSVLKTRQPPGKFFSYSGEGFMYLQLAVEHLLKQSLEKIAAQEVFIPLNMKSSSFLWQPRFNNSGAYGHNKSGEMTGRNEYFLPGAAYSLLTTAADYSIFVQALMDGRGLSPATHKQMFRDTTSILKKDSSAGEAGSHISWGPGVGIQRNELGTAIWHWGDNGDFKSFFIGFPALHKSLAYFSNNEKGLDILAAVLDYYFGKHEWWCLQWLDKEF
jgi:CubicO group peptidase (beta-lactamase class C family)